MRSRNLLLAGALLFAACSSSSGNGVTIPKSDLAGFVENDLATSSNNNDFAVASGDMAGTTPGSDGGMVITGTNTTPLVVDDGPSSNSNGTYNAAYVTVTICPPNSTSSTSTGCSAIDHVAIDTGSVGLRIISSQIPSATLGALSVEQSSGKNVYECYTFADGYTWGSVRQADVYIGGEKATGIPFHVIGDSEATIPTNCSSYKNGNQTVQLTNEDTVDAFGYNGLIGIAGYGPDCGSECVTTAIGQYYTCTSTTSKCSTDAKMPLTDQAVNPISVFAQDNNGVIIDLPDPGDQPAGTQTGTLVFGINTQTNNQMGSAINVYPYGSDDITSSGYNMVSTLAIGGVTATDTALFDSGTTDLVFDDQAAPIATCQDEMNERYCPSALTPIALSTTDANNNTHSYSFNIQSADTLFQEASQTDCAFKDIADPAGDTGKSIILGLPFFYGRPIYVGIDGSTITGQTPPFEAF